MARDFSSKIYKVGDGFEESSADTNFALGERWRNSDIPMILLNQHDVQGIQSFCSVPIQALARISLFL